MICRIIRKICEGLRKHDPGMFKTCDAITVMGLLCKSGSSKRRELIGLMVRHLKRISGYYV